MSQGSDRAWEHYLNPDVVRPRLIASSLFITAFEFLNESIVERLHRFYWRGFNESGDLFDPTYETEVLSRNRSPLFASLEWLRDRSAITTSDIEAYVRIKDLRNRVAHELQGLVADGLPEAFETTFADLVALLRKIELWWIVEVEIPTNPDFDGQEIDYEGIVPGPVMHVQLLCSIALGSDDESRFYHREFMKRRAAENDA